MSLALGTVLAQGALGLGQAIAGAVKKKPIIPEADVPQEVFDSMTDAEYWSYIGMPPEQRQRYVEDIQRSGATALSRSGDRKGGLGMVSQIAQGEREGYRDVADMDTKLRMRNIDRLYERRDRMTAEKNRADEINRQVKLDERERRDNIIGAGLQNIMGAAGTAGTLDVLMDGGIQFPNLKRGGRYKTGNTGLELSKSMPVPATPQLFPDVEGTSTGALVSRPR